jgi:hypothetical protein
VTAAVREIGVALLGPGNVGAGVVKLLEDNAAAIGARLGGRLVVRAIAVREPRSSKKRLVEVDPALLTADVAAAIARPDVDIVCELMGGDGLAKDAVMAAIAAGKHVVTANKLLWPATAPRCSPPPSATAWTSTTRPRCAAACRSSGSCARAWPRIASSQLHGIVNGTSNFILTTMAAAMAGPSPTPWPRRSAWATPRPTPASTSAVATPPTSWRSCAACVSAPPSTLTRSRATRSRRSTRPTSPTPPSSATSSGPW